MYMHTMYIAGEACVASHDTLHGLSRTHKHEPTMRRTSCSAAAQLPHDAARCSAVDALCACVNTHAGRHMQVGERKAMMAAWPAIVRGVLRVSGRGWRLR